MSREVVESPFVHMPKKKQASAYLSEVYKMSEVRKITRTIQDPLRIVRQAGGRKGWRVLPPAQKTKKMKSRAHFPYLRCAQPHIQYKTLSVFLVGQEGGRAGEFLPPAQKTKNKMSRTHFSYLRCVCAGKQASAYTQPSRDRGRVRTF